LAKEVTTLLHGNRSTRPMLAPSSVGSFVNLTVAVKYDHAHALLSAQATHVGPDGHTVTDPSAKSRATVTADGAFTVVSIYLANRLG
jgi:hypothetical protein